MIFEAIIAAVVVALLSVVGAVFFGNKLQGVQRYVIPGAVGVFLALILFELIPETLHEAPTWGAGVIALGFIGFYILSHTLHTRHHHGEDGDCARKSSATLILIGDAVHNIADGIVIAAAFFINPAVGIATTIGIALHEIPQEIVEFGILVRAGYTKLKAVFLNLLSASSVLLGVMLFFALAEFAEESMWILSGLAAGTLLFLAASDLLPRIHGNLPHYGNIWLSVSSIVLGFVLMGGIITIAHDYIPHAETHEEEAR